MKLDQSGYNFIKSFEGCRLVAYADIGGTYTIGWGAIAYTDGSPVKEGDTISQQEADDLFDQQADIKAAQVDSLNLNINQNKFNALTDFTYEEGFDALEESTLLKFIRANPDDPDISGQFLRWDFAGGKRVIGILKRRRAEVTLYFTPVSSL
jgi:lysozyme